MMINQVTFGISYFSVNPDIVSSLHFSISFYLVINLLIFVFYMVLYFVSVICTIFININQDGYMKSADKLTENGLAFLGEDFVGLDVPFIGEWKHNCDTVDFFGSNLL